MSVIDNSSWAIINRHFHPPGTAPGTLVKRMVEGDQYPAITMIQYSEEFYFEKTFKSILECWKEEKPDYITWINIEGNCTTDILEALGEHYHLHPLSLEDVLHQSQHPKLELYDGYYFLVMYLLANGNEKDAYQLSIFFGQNFLITIYEHEENAFELVRKHLHNSKQMRSLGTDYLCYTLCDTVIDRFFPQLQQFSEQMDILEDDIFSGSGSEVIEKIHNLKIKLLILGKLALATQEVIYNMQNEDTELIKGQTLLYLRDCYDHTVQLNHTIESYREISTGIMDSYLSLQNNKMSQVIKVLTIIATIFIPLTFIVGVYGMNFNPDAGPWSMPELNWPYGYVTICGGMALLSIVMLITFKRKKWM